ncbi:unnamed protein product [Parnassius mnemosyne]|uniref:F-box domain-containing protein n=1 Tax=Parnassius mnemosyne TaxID=213953 RepID=A0AAV1LED0_9NEOP
MNGKTLLELPFDILVNIFSILCTRDLRNLMLTCKTLKNVIINNNHIWRKIGQNKLIIRNSINSYESQSWYKRCLISHNWHKGIYKNQIVLHHDTLYMPWLKFHNSEILLLALGSDLFCFPTDRRGLPNCRKTLWALDVPTIKRYDVRTNDISRFITNDILLLCANRDGCVSVFQLNGTKKRPSLLCHIEDCHKYGEVEVTAVEAIKSKTNVCVVTGSQNCAELCMWSWNFMENNDEFICSEIQNMNCKKKVKPLSGDVGVRCLATSQSNDRLAIGLTGNNKPLVLNCEIFELQEPVDLTKNGKFAVRDIQWHNQNTLAYVSHSGYLRLLDIRTNNVVYESMDPFQSSLYCVKSDGNHALVVGTSEYSRCVLFDARRPARHVQMYFTQKKSSPIYSLDFSSSKLIAAADRSIAFVDFDVNPAAIKKRDYSQVFELVKR